MDPPDVSPEMSEPFALLYEMVIAKIQHLPAKERHETLQDLKVKYTAELPKAFNDVLRTGDTDSRAGDQQINAVATNIVEFGLYYNRFLKDLDAMLQSAFDSYVRYFASNEIPFWDSAQKVEAMLRCRETTSLCKDIESQILLRTTIQNAIGGVRSPDDGFANELERQLKEQQDLLERAKDGFMIQAAHRVVSTSALHMLRNVLLGSITAQGPVDIRARLQKLGTPTSISIFEFLTQLISVKQVTISVLQRFGTDEHNEPSAAVKEEREYLAELVDVRDALLWAIDNMAREYRGLLSE